MREDDFQRQVIELAQLHGWKVAHFRAALTSKGYRTAVEGDGAGFPDLVLSRGPELIFAELKSDKGKLSKAQVGWLVSLRAAIDEVCVWRPSDFDGIQARLERRTAVAA